MKYLQLLNFEIGDRCNLAKMHPKCPVNARPRDGKTLTDEKIMSLVREAYGHGFRGFVAWHYYNEPLLQATRIFNLMEQIRSEIPQSRFLLWTNGTILPEDHRMSWFEHVYCTNYWERSGDELWKCFQGVGWIWIKSGDAIVFDDRLNDPVESVNYGRCLRPLVEFIVDYFGVVHFCCYDWKSLISIGNVWQDSLAEILSRKFELVKKVCGSHMHEDAPHRCICCTTREEIPEISDFDKAMSQEAFRWANENLG